MARRRFRFQARARFRPVRFVGGGDSVPPMKLLIPPPELVPFGLRALKTVALSDGELAEREGALLDAAKRMLSSDLDIEALEPITADTLAAQIRDPALRTQLLRAMLVMSLIDGEASEEEARCVEAFRVAFDIPLDEVQTFRKIADGRIHAARLDIARRFWAREHIVKNAKDKGIGWLARAVASFLRIAEDRALADQYRALEALPAGTLGRAYFDFIRHNGFSLPGEKGSPPEVIAIHDLTHVLSGYGTDPEGEIYVSAFHAGYRKENPFTWILFSMMQFNLGHAVSPIAPGSRADFDPHKLLEAGRRGASMNTDLTDGSWDYWADLPLPLATVRDKYGVPPVGALAGACLTPY